MIATVARVDQGGPQPIFSGGTSLSKAYGLIQRFSEDVDFKFLLPEGGIARDARRRVRQALVGAIRSRQGWTLGDDDVAGADESRFFRCEVEYSPIFVPDPPARRRIRARSDTALPRSPSRGKALAVVCLPGAQTVARNRQDPVRGAG